MRLGVIPSLMKFPRLSLPLSCILLVAGHLAMTSCVGQPVAGGFSTAETTKPEVREAAKFAVAAQAKQSGAKISLVAVTAAQEQVVAGMKYVLTLKVSADGKERSARAVVWSQAWNKETPLRLLEWTWE
jgi:hypothetical protein